MSWDRELYTMEPTDTQVDFEIGVGRYAVDPRDVRMQQYIGDHPELTIDLLAILLTDLRLMTFAARDMQPV